MSQTTTDQNGSDEQALRALEREWGKAHVQRDRATIDGLLADDFIGTNFFGKVADKAKYIELHVSVERKFETFETEDVEVRIYGNAAVLAGLVTLKGQNQDNDFTFQNRYTGMYVKQQGRWQILAWQETSIS